MFNVNQITSQLAKMPDQALQQYAAMHKNDPYTVSLALSESNRRKAMRQGAVPQPGQMPKVVDQDIAQMVAPPPQQMMPQQARPQMPPQAQQQLPENVGIGQLPAQNMQSMADGGIVGYADTGLVQSQLPGGLGILQQGSFGPQTGSAELEKRIATIQSNRRMAPNDKANLIAQIKQDFFKTPAPSMYTNTGAATTPTATPSMYTNTAAPAVTPAVTTSPTVTPSAATPAVTPDGKPKLPAPTASSGQGIKTEPSAGLPSVASFADQLMGIDKFLPKKEEAPIEETFMKKREDVSRPVYEKATAMVEKEKSRLNEGKEQDFYMALIEGGLEAAAGNSPNGLQNLAAGFSKGAKSYSVALKDFRKAAQENSKMELDIERARAAEKRGDMDAFQKYDDSIKNRNADIDKLKTSGIFALQNVNTSGAYQLQSTGMTTSSQEKIAKLNREAQVAIASANSPLALYTALGEAKPGSALRTGFDLQTLKAHAASLQETWSRQAYPNGNMNEPNMAFLARYPDPKAYINENLQAMGSDTGGGIVQQAPPGATVIPKKQP
jgi:hypothetical protein